MKTHRLPHIVILAAVLALVTLPSLGATSLWDMDEGVNAECTREMMETGTWIVPTYNYDLRTAKPVMLYWLQRASYNLFGVSEWSARLPSVILSFGTILVIYELGRRLFAPVVGLLAGIVLASNIEFVKLACAATPDATLIFFSTLTLTIFYLGQRFNKRWWFVPAAVTSALGVLTKGPAGLALPGLVILLFLAWNRELHRLWDRRLIWAGLAFTLVAAPWYGLVAAETRGAYVREFFGNENVNRFLAPKENHKGPIYYYLLAMLMFFAPWSVVLGATLWNGIRAARVDTRTPPDDATRSHRFLLVWVLSYLVFFSIAATKLPNYIAPLYPALSLLTASFLIRWVCGMQIARWVMPMGIAGLAIVAVAVGAGLLILGGVIAIPGRNIRLMPSIAPWAALGLVPLFGAVALCFTLKQHRERFVAVLAVTSVAFMAILTAFPLVIVDAAKAPKSLVEESGARQLDRDIRLASLEYTQESMTFYAERRIERLRSVQSAADFLAMPRPAYLFIPERIWIENLAGNIGPYRIAARKFDFFRNAEILVVTNDGVQP